MPCWDRLTVASFVARLFWMSPRLRWNCTRWTRVMPDVSRDSGDKTFKTYYTLFLPAYSGKEDTRNLHQLPQQYHYPRHWSTHHDTHTHPPHSSIFLPIFESQKSFPGTSVLSSRRFQSMSRTRISAFLVAVSRYSSTQKTASFVLYEQRWPDCMHCWRRFHVNTRESDIIKVVIEQAAEGCIVFFLDRSW